MKNKKLDGWYPRRFRAPSGTVIAEGVSDRKLCIWQICKAVRYAA